MWHYLTHWGRMTPLCASNVCHHWVAYYLVAFSTPSHYRSQRCLIIKWTLVNKVRWNLNRNTKCIRNVVSKMATILSRSKCIKLLAAQNIESTDSKYKSGENTRRVYSKCNPIRSNILHLSQLYCYIISKFVSNHHTYRKGQLLSPQTHCSQWKMNKTPVSETQLYGY